MIPLSLSEVADATGGRPLDGPADVTVTAGVTTDSRQIEAGALFGAVRGARADGHDFLAQVLDAGAAGALVDRRFAGSDAHRTLLATHPDAESRLVEVEDPISALGALARVSLARLRERRTVHVVGITGSVGKTTTKDLVAAVLRGDTPAEDPAIISPPGSFNNELGLPLTVLRATEATDVLVLEMGADHVGNIDVLTSIAPPDVAVVLAIARAHLGEFGGIEAVARAKSEMVTGALPGATVVLNADDPRVAAFVELADRDREGRQLDAPRRVVRYGCGPEACAAENAVTARDVRVDASGRAHFLLCRGEEELGEVHLGLVGAHHVSNALAAAAITLALGVEPADVVARLGAAAASPHRMAVTERHDGVLVIDDAYNANPDSMRAALAALDTLAQARSRRIAVLGVMLELGDASQEEHRSVGAEAARRGVDVVIAVGEFADDYLTGAMNAGTPTLSAAAVATAEEAEALLAKVVRPGDVVLFKGSNGSGLWRLADRFTHDGQEGSGA